MPGDPRDPVDPWNLFGLCQRLVGGSVCAQEFAPGLCMCGHMRVCGRNCRVRGAPLVWQLPAGKLPHEVSIAFPRCHFKCVLHFMWHPTQGVPPSCGNFPPGTCHISCPPFARHPRHACYHKPLSLCCGSPGCASALVQRGDRSWCRVVSAGLRLSAVIDPSRLSAVIDPPALQWRRTWANPPRRKQCLLGTPFRHGRRPWET